MDESKLVLIGCSAKKLSVPARACELYQGNLFKLSMLWAMTHGYPWAVLSAHYGLVQPNDELKPYDLSLGKLTTHARLVWGEQVEKALRQGIPSWRRIVFLAGEHYRHAVRGFELEGRVEFPLEGMGIGQRMSWLKRHAKAVTA